MPRITDPGFKYTPAEHTNVLARFRQEGFTPPSELRPVRTDVSAERRLRQLLSDLNRLAHFDRDGVVTMQAAEFEDSLARADGF